MQFQTQGGGAYRCGDAAACIVPGARNQRGGVDDVLSGGEGGAAAVVVERLE
ncbi:MAG: hypothetical protein U0175_27300 [Caldilineaceae bacterium]